MRTPRSLDIEITSRCNLRCRYCYYFANPAVAYRDLAAHEWLRFFSELGGLGVMDLVLAGGEPFIREDLPVLIGGIVRNRMRFSLLSNGGLITDALAAFLAATGRCDSVQVSVDGSRPETHDSCRGSGSFEGAMRGIAALRRHGVNTAVRVTIHRGNVDDLEDTARLLLEELRLPGFSTNAAGYLGACRMHADDVLLGVRDREKAMATLLSLSEKYPGRISANAGPLSEARMWREMEDARRRNAPPSGGRLTACGCPASRIAVRADGAIVPCAMLPHIELGRINRDSLARIWLESVPLTRLRERHAIALTGFALCRGCPYVPWCTGNCPGLAYTLTGEVDHPSPDACLRRFLAEGGTVP